MFALLLVLLAFLVGYSVHRGGICLVGATLEVIEHKRADTFLFVLEAMSVAFAVVLTTYLMIPMQIKFAPSIEVSSLFLSGAMLYGVGASINGGCALGTLNQLMAGRLTFLGTILGMSAGFFGFLVLHKFLPVPETITVMRVKETLYILLPLLFLAWAVILFRFWQIFVQRKLSFTERVHQFLKKPLARSFIAIFLLGVGSGMLYLLLGHSWDYSRWIMDAQKFLFLDKNSADLSSPKTFWHVSVATFGLLTGIITAALIGHSFQLSPIQMKAFLVKISGGALMGFSAGFMQGGNDTLLLYGVPTLAFHAPIAIILIIFMIGLILLLKAKLGSTTGI